ncbi:MAG: restriction endonuclease subunit S, partial [Chloroflexi bacterium]|nr:restriction endonuclease subunit S [Chloroflexota bacterium]
SGVEWLGDVPAHWEVRRLKEAATIIAGQSPPSAIVSEFLDNFPFLQGNAEFGSNHPTPRLACERPPKQAMAGDILLSVRAPVGALNFANRDYGIGRGLCAIRSRTRLHRRLTYYSLGVASQELLRLSTGSTYDAVTVGTVGGLNIPLPPLPEQTAIVEHIDNATANIDAAIARARRQIDLLREYRTRLIADVVTGKLDVREAAAELPEGVGQ